MVFSAPIENMNNIFYCLVKSTYVDFLALTLITTNYCSSTFISVTKYKIFTLISITACSNNTKSSLPSRKKEMSVKY